LAGVVPCPICAAEPVAEAPSQPLPFAAEIPADPIASLPADISQMETFHTASRPRSWLPVTAAFGLGVAMGAGGLILGQRMTPPGQTDSVARIDPASHAEPFPRTPSVALAPLPHELRIISVAPSSKPEPKTQPKERPKPARDLPALARIEPINLNQPDAAYTLPRLERKGEHIVLRGKVRLLRINGLGAGAILDASGLEAGSIFVCGSIDGGSRLRINCPDGVVELPASVSERSRVEIHAPGSSVRFVYPTTPERPGSLIGGGASVAITARTVDLRGDVTGAGTRVKITLTRNGSLRAAAVRGAAVVEYRTDDPKAPTSAAIVAPTATYKKVD
jgi:hypothetical protein